MRALFLTLLLVGCPPTKEDTGDADDWFGSEDTGPDDTEETDDTGTSRAHDEDGDGYEPSTGDCDDSDPSVNPGASERCDGVDNNCDGEIDEGTASTWYADADGDGFGDSSSSAESCTAPAGYTANSNDCDDSDSGVFPGNLDSCDGLDNDCDGEVDEEGTSTYYYDGDGDGFGDPGTAISSCTPAAGYVSTGSDCDDTDPAIYPGAVEVCDGFDNDCDATVDVLADGTAC